MEVRLITDLDEAATRLEREPLRNIVLLKHIEAFRDHVSVVQLSTWRTAATLVLLDTARAPTIAQPTPRRRLPRSLRATTAN